MIRARRGLRRQLGKCEFGWGHCRPWSGKKKESIIRVFRPRNIGHVLAIAPSADRGIHRFPLVSANGSYHRMRYHSRSGLRLARGVKNGAGIFAVPVIRDFLLTHQWLRELNRRGFRTVVDVYFRLPADEIVLVGQYNERKTQCTAGGRPLWRRAKAYIRDHRTEIEAREIHSTRWLLQTHGVAVRSGCTCRGIFCGCEYCMKGQSKSRDIRARWQSS